MQSSSSTWHAPVASVLCGAGEPWQIYCKGTNLRSCLKLLQLLCPSRTTPDGFVCCLGMERGHPPTSQSPRVFLARSVARRPWLLQDQPLKLESPDSGSTLLKRLGNYGRKAEEDTDED